MSYEYKGSKKGKTNNWKDYVKLLVMPVRKRNELDRKYVDNLVENIYRLNISAGAKVSFMKYLFSKDKGELQKYRRESLYGFFNSERAFSLSRSYEKEGFVWYNHMCEALSPDVNLLEETVKQKVIANLALENSAMRESGEATRLFESIVKKL